MCKSMWKERKGQGEEKNARRNRELIKERVMGRSKKSMRIMSVLHDVNRTVKNVVAAEKGS